MNAARPALLCLLALGLGACAADQGAPPLELPEPVPVAVPAGPDAALPHLAMLGEDIVLSWVEPLAPGHVLRFTAWTGDRWSEPRAVARGEHWFINWADFPTVVPLGGGRLAAHWLQKSGPGTYAYDVVVTRSTDGGATWSSPVRPHTDGTQTEHGFVSLFAHEGELAAVWLDGRRYADSAEGPATEEMSVRFTTMGSSTASGEVLVDGRACDCCQTTATVTARGPLVAYRDRSPDEIRDVVVTRLENGRWTEPRAVHADGWQIAACPVNGPQADALEESVAVAWFTAAQDTPRVLVAFSRDAGATFAAPIRIDEGAPIGRVDVVLVDADRALVSWLERSGEEAEVRVRLVWSGGTVGAPRTIATTSSRRASGFPRMARYDRGVLLAWTEPGEKSVVHAIALPVPASE